MSRKKRPSFRPRSRRDRDQSPESKAIKKEMNLKKKEHGGGKRKSKGKKERFIKEELTGTVSMTREGYGFVEVPDRDNDVFVPQHKMRGALNGDIVKVLTTKAAQAYRGRDNHSARALFQASYRGSADIPR